MVTESLSRPRGRQTACNMKCVGACVQVCIQKVTRERSEEDDNVVLRSTNAATKEDG